MSKKQVPARLQSNFSSKIEPQIYEIRSQRVILDTELAKLYSVTTKQLNQAVRRNLQKFPSDFMFQLSFQEVTRLRSQLVTSKPTTRGGRQYLPYVFTEYGAIMAANVLRSEQAIIASIQVVRAFVRLREMVISHRDLEQKLKRLENKYDTQFKVIFEAIRQLMQPPTPPKRRIGF